MIRVLCVDDHEAVRAGLQGLLAVEPGFVAVGSAADEKALWPALNRTRPDVVLLDYQLPGTNGLLLCQRIKRTLPAPRVVLYSVYAEEALAVPGRLAKTDAIVSKGAPATELFAVLREVARGAGTGMSVTPAMLEAASASIDPDDLPIMGLMLDDTPAADIADVLGIDVAEVSPRIERMIGRLTGALRRNAPA
jgi:two-component system response regulator DesR